MVTVKTGPSPQRGIQMRGATVLSNEKLREIIECSSMADKKKRFLELLNFDMKTYEVAKDSSAVLQMEVNSMHIRHIDGVPRDEDSLSQRVWTLGEGASSPVTSGNVFRSLNNRTQVIGLVADAAHGVFEDPLEAYCRGRTLLLGEERDLDVIVGQDLSRKSSDLARLLHIARCDAYENSNPVILVLIQSTEQTVENKEKRTLLEEYGSSQLYHFPAEVDEPMWRKLQNCDTTEQVLKALDSRNAEKRVGRKAHEVL
ncbi:unnamed protein product [Heligmosomoides polygyrus]|uniref:ILEI domain-containing protein n=1 Tax=Heligmosomoides polygyrus TaxID=6339 RepID=A0A183GV77_HELPZ|nr:unnamed protein product [Heligmosomoides polygyrus]